MKCIHCGSDSKLKERKANGGRCSKCYHRFAFEPTTDPRKITDGLFDRCIKDVSGDGALFFTEKQLWYELNRRLLRKIAHIPSAYGVGASVCGVGGIVGFMAGTAVLLPVGLLAGIAALVVGAVVGKRTSRNLRVIVSQDDFRNKYLSPYVSAHGLLSKLLPDVRTRARQTTGIDAPADLSSYSFDRALVTQHAETAAMLVANRFHFENNCAILSSDRRYPDNGRFEMIHEMLKRNPSLTVFGIHDCSNDGMPLLLSLRGDDWFPERTVRLVALGLRPLHVMKGGFLLTSDRPSSLETEIASLLRTEEVEWLKRGEIAEIESLRPARLMRAIYLGFNQANVMPATNTGPDGVVVFGGGQGYGGDVWAGDGRSPDVYAMDSFG